MPLYSANNSKSSATAMAWKLRVKLADGLGVELLGLISSDSVFSKALAVNISPKGSAAALLNGSRGLALT